MPGIKILGDINNLLNKHSDEVDTAKAILAIEYATETSIIDVEEINRAADKGCLYVSRDGTIFEDCTESEERAASYKLVPTGLSTKFNNVALLAAFYKDNGMWKGVYIATIDKLFSMYRKYYKGEHPFSEQYTEFFSGENGCKEIIGFGLTEVLNNFKNGATELINNPDITVGEPKSVGMELGEVILKPKTKLETLEQSLTKAESSMNSKKMSKSQRKKIEQKIAIIKRDIEKEKIASGLIVEETTVNDKVETKVEDVNEPLIEEEKPKVKRTRAKKTSKKSEKEEELAVEPVETVEKPKRGRPRKTVDKTEVVELVGDKLDQFNEGLAEVRELINEKLGNFKVDLSEEFLNKVVSELKQIATVETQPVSSETSEKEKSTAETTKTAETVDRTTLIENELSEIAISVSSEDVLTVKEVCNEIYNRLMFKENWLVNGDNRLAFYLKSLLTHIYNKLSKAQKGSQAKERGDGYVFSDNKRKLLINTNLIDKYGNSIYVIDHTPYSNDFYKKSITVMTSKSSLVDEGFGRETAKNLPGPVVFAKKSEFIFDACIDDFDLEDEEHLNHIINERRGRFPAKYANESASVISAKLKSNVEQALKISAMDYRYILPMYNLVQDEIEFLIPFHLDTHYGEKPELAIIVSKKKSFWKIFTILPSDLAYDNARLICNPRCTWVQ